MHPGVVLVPLILAASLYVTFKKQMSSAPPPPHEQRCWEVRLCHPRLRRGCVRRRQRAAEGALRGVELSLHAPPPRPQSALSLSARLDDDVAAIDPPFGARHRV